MASPNGTSSGSSSLQSCDDQTLLVEQRKRKRMISNRESARRSRMRKQKHLDDLMTQLTQLRSENNHIVTNINAVNQMHLKVESENSVLRAQMSELNHRLGALNDIISFMNAKNIGVCAGFESYEQMIGGDDDFFDSWNLFHSVDPPIMDALMY